MSRSLNNFLVGLAVVLIAAVGLLYAGPRLVDWNQYRGVFEEEASRLTGRDVRVGGNISVRLLPAPLFSVEKVRVTGGPGTTGDAFFRADTLKARLSITPLLRGIVETSDLELVRPHFHLAMADTPAQAPPPVPSADASFMPSNVAFQAVRIVDGTFSLDGSDRQERLRLDRIDGELSTPALDGPYRFRGTYGTDAARRDLRVTTSRPEADGSIRFKSGLKQLETGSTYNFDGRVLDIWRAPQIEGELAAQIVLPKAQPVSTAPPNRAKPEADAPLEIKASVTARAATVKLVGLTLAFEQQGRPQILSGDADIFLGRTTMVRTALEARWLDLDNIISTGHADAAASTAANTAESPLALLLGFATRLNGLAPTQGNVSIALNVDQANLGREAVSGLRLNAESRSGITTISDLRIGLPGGTRADAQGRLAGHGADATFEGDVVVRGHSLARLLAWSSPHAPALDPSRDGPYAIRSRIKAAHGQIEAQNFVGELAGTIMQGDIGYSWKGRRELSVLIEGPQVDLRALLPEPAPDDKNTTNPILTFLRATSGIGRTAGDLDAVVKIRTGRLLIPGASYQDVVADIELRQQQFFISKLLLNGEHGVALDLEGELAGLDGKPRGSLRGTVGAQTVAGVDALVKLLDWPTDLLPDPAKRAMIVPLRLAGSADFGRGNDAAVDIAADGLLGETRLIVKARLDRGAAAWRIAPLDLTATLDGARADQLAHALFPTLASAAGQEAAPSRTVVSIKSLGALPDGLTTTLRADGQGTAIQLAGRIVGPSPLRFEGEISAKTLDMARLQPWLLGFSLPGRSAVGLEGTARIAATAAALRLDRIVARVGASNVEGQLTLTPETDRFRIAGQLAVNQLPTAAVFEAVTARRTAGATTLAAATAAMADRGGAALWPLEPFDFSAIARLDGTIDVTAERLQLADGVGLDRARFALAFQANQLEIRDLEGLALGGRWTGSVKLVRADAANASLNGALRLTNAHFEQVTSDAGSAARIAGRFGGALTFTATGSSPQDLATKLNGKGALDIAETRTLVLAPAAVTATLDAGLKGDPAALAETLRTGLRGALGTGAPLVIQARQIPLELVQGRLNSGDIAIPSASGSVTAGASLDLTSLVMAATWRVVGSMPPDLAGKASAAALPPVVITTSGPAGTLARQNATVNADALEREASVRKMERDVDELERLRKLDQERMRLETERRQQQEAAEKAARDAALAAAAAAASPPVVAPQVAPPTPQTSAPPVATVQPGTPPPPQAVQQSADPQTGARPRPATAPPSAPKDQPAYRPLNSEEMRKLFGGG